MENKGTSYFEEQVNLIRQGMSEEEILKLLKQE